MTIQEFHSRLETANDQETQAYQALTSDLSKDLQSENSADASWAIWSE